MRASRRKLAPRLSKFPSRKSTARLRARPVDTVKALSWAVYRQPWLGAGVPYAARWFSLWELPLGMSGDVVAFSFFPSPGRRSTGDRERVFGGSRTAAPDRATHVACPHPGGPGHTKRKRQKRPRLVTKTPPTELAEGVGNFWSTRPGSNRRPPVGNVLRPLDFAAFSRETTAGSRIGHTCVAAILRRSYALAAPASSRRNSVPSPDPTLKSWGSG